MDRNVEVIQEPSKGDVQFWGVILTGRTAQLVPEVA